MWYLIAIFIKFNNLWESSVSTIPNIISTSFPITLSQYTPRILISLFYHYTLIGLIDKFRFPHTLFMLTCIAQPIASLTPSVFYRFWDHSVICGGNHMKMVIVLVSRIITNMKLNTLNIDTFVVFYIQVITGSSFRCIFPWLQGNQLQL